MLGEITALILAYKYWAIFPFALFEAPLLSIVVGFFIATGQLDLVPAFAIVILGDVTGDTALYVFGRWGRPFFEKIGFNLHVSHTRVRQVLSYFGQRDRRAIVISKLVHGVGFTGLIVAGSIGVPYHRFIVTCIIVSLCQSAALLAAGMLSGRTYQSFALYLGYFDIILAAVVLVALFYAYRMLIGRLSEEDAKS